MNYKSIIFYLFLLFSVGESCAQLSKFRWSEPVKKEGNSFLKILNFEENSIVVFKPESSSIRLDIFSKGRHLTSESVSFKGEYLEVFKVGRSIVIFSIFPNGKSKKDELYAKIINPESKKELLIIEQSWTGTLRNHFKVEVSPNSQKVFVLTETPHKEGRKETAILTILNDSLEVERSTDYLMAGIESQRRKINVPVINDKGDVYLLKRYREGRGRSQYYILTYPTAGEPNLDEFRLNYKTIHDVQYLLSKEGGLIIGGTYSSKNSIRSEGTYIAKFNSAGEKLCRKEYDFREETILVFTSKRTLRKDGFGLSSFRTNCIIQQKENIHLILEHRTSEENSKTGINTEIRAGLIVFTYDLKGNFVWDNPIEMHQSDDSESGYWNSFILFNDTINNKLNLIYNEIGYFDKKADNEFGLHAAVGARSIVIDNQGNYTKKAVKESFEGVILDLVINPKVSKQIGKKMLIIAETLDKTIYVLGVVE
jgi:hypothetical protein